MAGRLLILEAGRFAICETNSKPPYFKKQF
jgi:hypothetical protein